MALAEAFLARLRGTTGASEPLERELAGALQRARDACPGIHVADEPFAEALATRLTPGMNPLEALRAMHVEDLYLAVACAGGDEAALAEFERRYTPEIRSTLSRMGLSTTTAEETLQVLREELLVGGPGTPPKITGYAGRGELRRWLRAVAGRTGVRLARQTAGQTELHESATVAPDVDLEMAYLKRTYGGAFRQAFREAFRAAPAKEAILLQQRYCHGLTVEELGALYGVHASTVSRWVTDARERLVTATREAMMQELKVGRAEASSLLRLIQSELEITLSSITGVSA